MHKFLIIIAGPTAVGKTTLSIELAKHFNTEIISADSRQFYKELTIGTAKPTAAQLSEVKHHFVHSISIQESYSVADFEKQTIELLGEIFKGKDIVILTGGSGLFIDAVCKGLDTLPPADKATRMSLQTQLEKEGIKTLQEKLKQLDPVTYDKIDLQNPQRLIRALEVSIVSGKRYSEFLQKKEPIQRNFNIIKIVINKNRVDLYHAIDQRVDDMIKSGLLNEVKSLKDAMHLNALNTVGYKEFKEYFANRMTLEATIDQVKQNSRRYAKRQLTWFRKDKEYTWFEQVQHEEIISFIKGKINAD